jgi:pyrroline-5-carboxylate reductase
MPNLAAALGKSPLALVGQGLSTELKVAVEQLLAPLGTPEWLADEALFDLATALVGSGPAFVYRFIDALAAGGAALGFAPDQAERLALAMVDGAARLAATAPDSPAELARRVTSPGGTTEAGLRVLDSDGALQRLVEATLRAARDRGAELARAARD